MHRNEVRLVGRVSRPPKSRALPSGDSVLTWGMAVRRPPGHPSNKKSDGIICVTFDRQVAAQVAGWRVNDVVSVEGALHHRFWTGAPGPTGTYEVEVHHAQALRAPHSAPPTAAPHQSPLPAAPPAAVPPRTPLPTAPPPVAEKEGEGSR
ncbi:single-stranded DNA-binding protein [Sphaerisporangium sp. B11E5]|uniref:single-stranded DNA-binding protein n=1 Tax=Sphaerisporangium sp. B11E5 TaxID=3153563 RepID=UPI00325CEE6F